MTGFDLSILSGFSGLLIFWVWTGRSLQARGAVLAAIPAYGFAGVCVAFALIFVLVRFGGAP